LSLPCLDKVPIEQVFDEAATVIGYQRETGYWLHSKLQQADALEYHVQYDMQMFNLTN